MLLSVYPYEYMDGWDKFNKKSIPSKKSFCSSLTMEDITEMDYIKLTTYLKHLNLTIWVIIMTYMLKATHCYLRMSLKILEKRVLKLMN